MYKFLFLFLAFAFNLEAQTNFFEGRISMKLQYYDSLGNMLDPEILGKDSEMHYFISEENYKSLNEKGTLTQLFNGSTNKYFFNNQGQVQVIDASFKFPQSGTVSKLAGDTTILNHNCEKLLIKSENDQTIYYVTKDLIVDQNLFEDHNFGNWNLFLKSTNGALALKYVIKHTGSTMIMEAYEIEEMDLNEEDFNIESFLEK